MGDYRDYANDSRYAIVAYVREEAIFARAAILLTEDAIVRRWRWLE